MPILYLIAEWIAFLCSLLLFAKGVKKQYRWFILYCFFVICIEYTSRWMVITGKLSNHVLYNFAGLVYDIFYLLSIRYLLENPRNKKTATAFCFLLMLAWVLNICFIQGVYNFNSYTSIFAYLLVTICCILYYVELITKNTIVLLEKEHSFYIVSGYFIFSLLTSLIYSLHEFFAYKKTPVALYRKVFNNTVEISNIALYLLLSVSFIIIWRKRKL